MVTTPVPPIPVTSTSHGSSRSGRSGSGSPSSSPGSASPPAFARRIWAPVSVTKLGQKPLTQDRSLLQEDWLIRRLRPYFVSSGSIETQFDLTEQSPQPSHTASLMKTRTSGSGAVPRLRRRRSSAAQVWS